MTADIVIRVQREDFSVAAEYEDLRARGGDAGAVVFFTGCVRGDSGSDPVEALVLEHYPGMTEASLQRIVQEATDRWAVQAARVVHRVGRLDRGEQIVFVGVASRHRGDAFAAAQFVMDYLKTQAPFWKKAIHASGERWVEANASDTAAAARWSLPTTG